VKYVKNFVIILAAIWLLGHVVRDWTTPSPATVAERAQAAEILRIDGLAIKYGLPHPRTDDERAVVLALAGEIDGIHQLMDDQP
jgi:hypothetical protein